MFESLILVEGSNVNEEKLRSLSLGNALQLVVGGVPGGGVILHVAANSAADLNAALRDFAQVPNVARVLTLMVKAAR